MTKRWLVLLLLLTLASLASVAVLADEDEDDADESEDHGGLVIDSVLIKGPTADGIEIEVRYWLVDIESLPGHPSKTTLIMDEATNDGTMLKKLQALVDPVSEEAMEDTPPGVLTFWDMSGTIRPGQPVTVSVAGLVVKHIVPAAGPGYVEGSIEEVRELAAQQAREKLPDDATLEVIRAKLGGAGGLLQVTFRTTGVEALSPGGEFSYVLDPETGERFDILRVPRLGMMAPKHLGEYEAGSYMVVRVPTGKITPGKKISVIVEGLRQDNVVVE